jgi:hypothetical protein
MKGLSHHVACGPGVRRLGSRQWAKFKLRKRRQTMKGIIRKLVCGASCALMFSSGALAGTKFDHAEYMKQKTEGQKKDEKPVKGSVSFDTDKKTVEFLDENGVSVISIPDDKIKSILYEQTSKPRYAEAILISPFFLFTHSKKHFLTIQYTDTEGQGKFAMIHMDKKNARDIVAAAEAETGKKVDRSEEK